VPPALKTPTLPTSFGRSDLEDAGFTGWRTWSQLRANDLHDVPDGPAAYVVYRSSASDPSFLAENPGGRFKGQDPTVPIETLQANWVSGARVIYIGKADRARRRLTQYARFGAGEPVGHWGGRLIWQLADSPELLVAWHAIDWAEAAREYERRLLAHFVALHDGRRPFANLTG
jgi:hypothetical protein